MRNFTDNDGRTWKLEVNTFTLMRVRDELEFDLLDVKNGKVFFSLADNPAILCEVIWILIEKEAGGQSVDQESFFRSMYGDPIDLAITALMEEIVNFFRKPAQRAVLSKALEKVRMAEDIAIEIADQKLDDPKIMEEIRKSIESDPGNSSGSSQESSASTQDPSRSDN